jgi:KaiC/GvpD/RAD55 family RecA-like ATPase
VRASCGCSANTTHRPNVSRRSRRRLILADHQTNFAAIAESVARSFWGDPNKALSTKTELRWGSQGSRAVFLDGPGNWKDFEQDIGGGVIDLVMMERKCSKADAITWLEAQDFIDKRDTGRSGTPGRQETHRTASDTSEAETAASEPPIEAKPVAVKGYRYTDGDGNPLYEVIRYQFRLPDGSWQLNSAGNPKKTFRQRRPDGRGGFIWNLEGIGHTIYRRQQVDLEISEGHSIFLVEGEKDVETLEAWGLVATTNSGGAKHWTPEMAKLLTGADVVIIPDNDDAGRAGAEIKAKSLKGIAARVRMLDLAEQVPGLPEKGDVTDWRDAMGGTADQLASMVASLGDWRPRPPRSGFGAQTSNTLATKAVAYDWLVKNLIERNGILIIAGESMAGKSFLVMDMGMKIARGVDYAERRVRQGAVIHMAVEDGKGTELRFKGYLKAHNLSPDLDLPYVVMDPYANGGMGFSLTHDDQVDKFISECLEWREFYGSLEFIIIDTLSMATEGLDENSSGEASKVLGRVNRIRERTGATVCLVHHMNAGGTKVRGSTALVANVPNVIEVRPLMTMPQNRKEEPRPILDSNGRPIRKARLAKNKNGVGNKAWNFVLEEVQLADVDQDGEHYSTMFCARPARSSAGHGGEEDNTRLAGDQKLVFDALVTAQYDHGQDMPEGAAAPPQIVKCVTQADFVASVRRVISFKSGEDEIEARNTELSNFLKRTTTALINAGYMGRDNDKRIVWWTGRSDRPRPRREPEAEPERPPTISPDVASVLASGEPPF